jgi:hypothetical protein
MANHGYINRNGITTVAQTLAGAKRLFNMGVDLTTFLAAGSVLFAGDIPTMTYSIVSLTHVTILIRAYTTFI